MNSGRMLVPPKPPWERPSEYEAPGFALRRRLPALPTTSPKPQTVEISNGDICADGLRSEPEAGECNGGEREAIDSSLLDFSNVPRRGTELVTSTR
jgi:hypothetical protein